MLHRLDCKEIYKLLAQIRRLIVSNKTRSLNIRQRQAKTAASISESLYNRYLSQGIQHLYIVQYLLRISEVFAYLRLSQLVRIAG